MFDSIRASSIITRTWGFKGTDMAFKEDVEKVLADFVNPPLQSHGGGVELVEANEKDGTVKVRLIGACYG
jgi:Fe-S cluster biogenesis protein NfuA